MPHALSSQITLKSCGRLPPAICVKLGRTTSPTQHIKLPTHPNQNMPKHATQRMPKTVRNPPVEATHPAHRPSTLLRTFATGVLFASVASLAKLLDGE